MLTNSPSPRWSRITATSAASSATVAVVAPSARRVEPPYPGRDQATTRSPRSSAAVLQQRVRYGGLGRAVVEDQREPVVGAGDQDLEEPAVGGGHVQRHGVTLVRARDPSVATYRRPTAA